MYIFVTLHKDIKLINFLNRAFDKVVGRYSNFVYL